MDLKHKGKVLSCEIIASGSCGLPSNNNANLLLSKLLFFEDTFFEVMAWDVSVFGISIFKILTWSQRSYGYIKRR